MPIDDDPLARSVAAENDIIDDDDVCFNGNHPRDASGRCTVDGGRKHGAPRVPDATPRPWTDAHRRGAFVRLCELAVEHAVHGDLSDGGSFVEYQPIGGFGLERDLRDHLRDNTPMHEDRIDREVAIVRQRAERPVAGRTRIDSAIKFLREAFRDDGAEGESVHLVCREIESMRGDLVRAHEEIDALRAGRVVPCVAALVTDRDGRLLLVRTKRGWELPGGRMEHGETWREAVDRELREETGLDVALDPGEPRVLDGLPVNGAKYQSIILVARGTVDGEHAPTPDEGDAVREAGWFARDELPADLSQIATAQVVREWAEEPEHCTSCAVKIPHAVGGCALAAAFERDPELREKLNALPASVPLFPGAPTPAARTATAISRASADAELRREIAEDIARAHGGIFRDAAAEALNRYRLAIAEKPEEG